MVWRVELYLRSKILQHESDERVTSGQDQDCGGAHSFGVGDRDTERCSSLGVGQGAFTLYCFDSILEWDGISGMEVVFDSLILLAVLIV